MREMTIDFFMEQIKGSVRDAAIIDTISKLKLPPGRKPRYKRISQSAWFNQLTEQDQLMVAAVMQEAVDEALFGLFAVLDSVRTIDDGFDEDGRFELVYTHDGKRILLNDPDGMDLHDEYNAVTNPAD